MIAAKNESFTLVQKLVEAGATIILKNNEGKTATDIAKAGAKSKMAADLLERVATQQKTLVAAVLAQDVDGLSKALGLGAKPKNKDENGTPILNLAIQAGFSEGVRRLMVAGAEVEEATDRKSVV